MAIVASVVVIPATAGGILLAGPGWDMVDRQSITVYNPSAVTVFVNGTAASCTTAAGFPILAGADLSVDLGPGDSLFGIVAAATQNVNVIKTRG